MKILFSDFDGTLFIRDKPEIFDSNLIAVEKWRKAGNKFALATGRSLDSIHRVFPEYSGFLDYVLANNGSIVFDSSSNKIFNEELTSNLVDGLTSIVTDKYPNSAKVVYFTDDSEVAKKPAGVIKVRVWLRQAEDIAKLCKDLTARFDDNIQVHPINYAKGSSLSWIGPEYIAFVDIVSIKAGKENAINFVLQADGIDRDSVFSVGDDVNDINMLKEYNGYAIEESVTEVIYAADGRTVDSVSSLINDII